LAGCVHSRIIAGRKTKRAQRPGPAIDREEFGQYDQRWVAGASVKMVAPTGDYEADRLLNLGSNRWSLRPEVGFSRAVRKWIFEGAASV